MRVVVSCVSGVAAALFAVGSVSCGARSALEGGPGGTSGASSGGAAGASGAGGTSGAPNPATDLCGALLDAMCTEYVECQRPQQFRDFDHCRSELDCYGVTALREAQAEGHILLDESALVACFRDFYASPCDPPRSQTSVFNDPLDIYQFVSQCPGVLTPLQGVGDVCKADAECEFRLKCQTASCPGVWTIEQRLQRGNTDTVFAHYPR